MGERNEGAEWRHSACTLYFRVSESNWLNVNQILFERDYSSISDVVIIWFSSQTVDQIKQMFFLHIHQNNICKH